MGVSENSLRYLFISECSSLLLPSSKCPSTKGKYCKTSELLKSELKAIHINQVLW